MRDTQKTIERYFEIATEIDEISEPGLTHWEIKGRFTDEMVMKKRAKKRITALYLQLDIISEKIDSDEALRDAYADETGYEWNQ